MVALAVVVVVVVVEGQARAVVGQAEETRQAERVRVQAAPNGPGNRRA